MAVLGTLGLIIFGLVLYALLNPSGIFSAENVARRKRNKAARQRFRGFH